MKLENNLLYREQPEIYCALSIVLNRDENIEIIIDEIHKLGILETKIIMPKFENIITIDIAIIQYEKSWYMDEILTKMFSKIDHCLIDLKRIIEKYHGIFCIDIAFSHDIFPALEFSGENMSKIRFLEADISIDAY